MNRLAAPSLAFALLLAGFASAADHRVEVLKQPAPADAVNKEIAAQLSPTGIRIVRGTNRTVCQIWLCKEWAVKPGFKPSGEVLYPFTPGQLIGVMQFTRKGGDFRDQDIAKGVYTLRYGQQPVDGNHEGTSPTRDFLTLVNAEKDTSAKPMELKALLKASTEAAGSSHPALFGMQKVKITDQAGPTIRHQERHDWWIVTLVGKATAGGKTSGLKIDLVVAGVAPE